MSHFDEEDNHYGQKLFHLLAADAAFVARKALLSPRSNSFTSLREMPRRPRLNRISSSFSYPSIPAAAAAIERSEFENAIAIAAANFSSTPSKNNQKAKPTATSSTKTETSTAATTKTAETTTRSRFTAEASIVSKTRISATTIPKISTRTASGGKTTKERKPHQTKTAINKTVSSKKTKRKKSNYKSLGRGAFLQEVVMAAASVRKMRKLSKVSSLRKWSMFYRSRTSNKKRTSCRHQ